MEPPPQDEHYAHLIGEIDSINRTLSLLCSTACCEHNAPANSLTALFDNLVHET